MSRVVSRFLHSLVFYLLYIEYFLFKLNIDTAKGDGERKGF